MSFLLLTMATPEMAAIARLSQGSREAYCRRHGYEHVCGTEHLDPTRHPVWSKLPLIERYLDAYDWIFFNDCDSLITNPAMPLEEMVGEKRRSDEATERRREGEGRHEGEPDLIITRDLHGVNAGQFLISGRSGRAAAFLRAIYEQTQFIDHPLREQTAMTWVIDCGLVPLSVRYVPKRRLNADLYDWREGDFLLHFYGQPARAYLMRQWARRLGFETESEQATSHQPARAQADALRRAGGMLQAGRADEAAEECRRIVADAPDDARALQLLGLALERQKRFDEAVDCLCRALDLAPDVADFHNNLGAMLARYGHPAPAAECFRAALRLRPGFAKAQANLAAAERSVARRDKGAHSAEPLRG